MIYELVLRNFDCSLEFVFSLLLLQPFNSSPVSFACNFQDWGCVILREIDFLWKICWSIPCLHPSWKGHISIYKFDPHRLVQDDLQRRMLLRGAYGLYPRSLIVRHLLQVSASPWTIEASTSERWYLAALANRKATSSRRNPSLISLFWYWDALLLYRSMNYDLAFVVTITVICY